MTANVAQPASTAGERWAHADLREWIERADALGHLRRVNGADWDLEIGGLTEMVCHHVKQPRCLLFDETIAGN